MLKIRYKVLSQFLNIDSMIPQMLFPYKLLQIFGGRGLFYCFFVLQIEPRNSGMLGKCSTCEFWFFETGSNLLEMALNL